MKNQLHYPWCVAYNRSGGLDLDFVLLPVFFTDKPDAKAFLERYCGKACEGDYAVLSGHAFTLGYVTTKKEWQVISYLEAQDYGWIIPIP